jgi:hypothetical protein
MWEERAKVTVCAEGNDEAARRYQPTRPDVWLASLNGRTLVVGGH